MSEFPRTMVGGVSLSRMIIGSNWLVGCSHQSAAKDAFLTKLQTRKRQADVLVTFLKAGIDTLMTGPTQTQLLAAARDAEQRAGRKIILVLTPGFSFTPQSQEETAEGVFDACQKAGAVFCLPHQGNTDALIDRRARVIRDIDQYTRMIRERGMIPGLSTHMPEAIRYADRQHADVETYIQPYNAIGFLMQVEPDWVMRVIRDAKKPVMTIKPLAAGRLIPAVALAFVWNTIRDQDMVTIGVTTPGEAKEVIDLSLDFLSRRMPSTELQYTRSKASLTDKK